MGLLCFAIEEKYLGKGNHISPPSLVVQSLQ